MVLKWSYLPDKILVCWKDFFSFLLKMRSIFSLDKVSPQAHNLQQEVGNSSSLKVIPDSRTSICNWISLYFPLCMLLQAVPNLSADSFTNQYIVPLFAREVGFYQASPAVGSRGSGHLIISGLFLLIIFSHGSLSVNILDLTGRVATTAVTGQPTFCWSDMPLMYTSDITLLDLARRSIQSSLSGHHMIFNITVCEDVYTADLLYGIFRNGERRERENIN